MNKLFIFAFLLIFVNFSTFAQRNRRANNERATKTINLTKAEFLKRVVNFEKNPTEWIYLGDKPSIINFYASWCPPCRMLAPILEQLAAEYEGQIYIYKINVDTERELAAAFGIGPLPTTIFVPMNDAPQMAQGALPRDVLKQLIDEILLGN